MKHSISRSLWTRSASSILQKSMSTTTSIGQLETSANRLDQLRAQMPTIPTLNSFLQLTKNKYGLENAVVASRKQPIPYLDPQLVQGSGQRVFVETYGCQMNVNDSQIVAKILTNHQYEVTDQSDQAEIILLMTCSIREGAETKIFNRLNQLRRQKEKGTLRQIGLIGCMASRLKNRLLERDRLVDVIVGPDSYRDLPNLLALTRLTGHNAVNVLLSLDETYADVLPTVTMNMEHEEGSSNGKEASHCQSESGVVQLNNWSQFRESEAKKAFVSIMRGCDNMCSYCVVPYTRGRERSRSIESILHEVRLLSDAGVKEITLLGQNVNSYRDWDAKSIARYGPSKSRLAEGFVTIYKSEKKGGITFDILLDQVAQVDPEMRIRFVSPHPKDFTEEVIDVIARYPNICKNIHLPAQSGDDRVLELMRRGYTKDSYLKLVQRIKDRIPDITFTSDFICGFTGETDEAFEHTLDLVRQVNYSFIFSFPYSVREKTYAHLHHADEIALDVKKERSLQVLNLFRDRVSAYHQSLIGKSQLILIEGTSRRSKNQLFGRNDSNTKVIIDRVSLPDIRDQSKSALSDSDDFEAVTRREIRPGDYVLVRITNGTSQTLFGDPQVICTLEQHTNSIQQRDLHRKQVQQ